MEFVIFETLLVQTVATDKLLSFYEPKENSGEGGLSKIALRRRTGLGFRSRSIPISADKWIGVCLV